MKALQWAKEHRFLLLAVLAGAILRCFKPDYQSVWVDEIFSLNQANPKLSLLEIFKILKAYDPHPPLYYFSLHFVFMIFGYSTLIMRLYSVVLGIAGLFAIYFLGKEIASKKVGLVAVLLTAINYFHLYYSQEARMYSMLFFTTTLSFYFLIRFIKSPSYKSAGWYSLFALLMIYTHFFALFALFAQYVILLFFVIRPYAVSQKKFLTYCLVSGISTMVFYIPAMLILFENTKRTSIWIKMPTADVYTQIFKDFFGNAETVLFFVFVLILLYIFRLFERKETTPLAIDPEKEKQVFSFFFLFTWILITLLIPLVLSYVNLPMLISRYMINILPAVIILVAIGFTYIRNTFVKMLVLSLIVLFSLTDIFVVKKYYWTVNKTQFREISEFVLKNNKHQDPVVSQLAPYFTFFVDNEKVKTVLIEKTLQDYVNDMKKDPAKIKPFWYVDAHANVYTLDKDSENFLDQHFFLEDGVSIYDAWARHYVIKSGDIVTEDISKYKPLKMKNGDPINGWVDSFEATKDTIKAFGWAYLQDADSNSSKHEIVLINNGKAYKLNSQKIFRDDVGKGNKLSFNVDYCGFSTVSAVNTLPAGTYLFGIIIKNEQAKKEGLIITDKVFNKP